MDEILDRQETCFSAGCIAFWTVDGKRQIILVTTADGTTVRYGGNSEVPIPEPHSGTIKVSAVFEA
jgi:hypothetical protein